MKRDECRVSRDEWMEKKKITVLTLCAMLFALCVCAEAQQATKISRLGLLLTGTPSSSSGSLEAFRNSLRKLGYIEGIRFFIARSAMAFG